MRSEKTAKLISILLTLAMLVTTASVSVGLAASADDTKVDCDYSSVGKVMKPYLNDYYTTLNMYDGMGLDVRDDGVLAIDLDWRWQVNSIDKAVALTTPYAIYNIAENTDFTVVFSDTTDISRVLFLSSADMVSWNTADTEINGKTVTVRAGSGISYVKIALPTDNNRDAGIKSVSYTATPENENFKRFDFSQSGTGAYESKGIYKGNTVQADYTSLDGAKTANSYEGYLTYRVQPGTRFSFNVTNAERSTDIDSIARKLGYEDVLDFNIEVYASSDNVTFEKLNVKPVYSGGHANNQPRGWDSNHPTRHDARRRADWNFIVPDGIAYIKLKFPVTQNLSTMTSAGGEKVWPYPGNDLFDINRVEFTSPSAEEAKKVNANYSAMSNKLHPRIKDYYTTFKMHDGVGLELHDGAIVIDKDWRWQVNSVDKAVELTNPYAIYNIEKGTEFCATFTDTTDISKIGFYASDDAVTWEKAEIKTDGKKVTVATAAKSEFVKIEMPTDDDWNAGIKLVTYTKAVNAANVKRLDFADAANTGAFEQSGIYKGVVIQPDWSALDSAKTENSYNGYLTYKVQPGTRFGFTVTSNRSADSAAEKLGFKKATDWNIEVYASSDNVSFEKLNVTPAYSARYANYQESGDARRSADWNFTVPDGIIYIKLKFPITQNLSTMTSADGEKVWPYVGNDLFDIDRVEYSAIKYDYYKENEGDYFIDGTLSDETKSDFGIYSFHTDIFRDSSFGNVFDGNWPGMYNNRRPYIDYMVRSGKAFYAEFITMYSGNVRDYTNGKDFVIEIQGKQANGDWVTAKTVTLNTENRDNKHHSVMLTAEENKYTYLRIMWPTKLSDSMAGNTVLGLAAVAFTEPYAEFDSYGTYSEYQYTGVSKLDFADEVYNDLLLYRYNGVEIAEFADGAAYLAATEDYAKNGAKVQRPYAVYLVKPDTDAVFSVTRDTAKCDAMGKNWNIKLYESADGKNWTENTATPETANNAGIGVIDTYKFRTDAETQYIKVEFPHSGEVNGESGARIIGLNGVGITPGEYGELDVYGTHEFGETDKYYDKEQFTGGGIIDALSKVNYKFYQTRSWSAYFGEGTGIQVAWDYLNGRRDVSKPYVSYNVVAGTAFQAEVTFNVTVLNTIEKALGTDFLPKLYVSADHRTWTEPAYSRVKLRVSKVNPKRGGLVLTLDEVPEGIKYVKVEFPMTGDVSLLTDGAFQYAGNDTMELISAFYTKGTETVPGELDNGQYEQPEDGGDDDNNYDFDDPDFVDDDDISLLPDDNGFDGDNGFDIDFGTEDENKNTAKEPKIRKGKRRVRKVVTVIDGYYYPWWVWTLWIGGGVLGIAAIGMAVLLIVKKKKKRT